MIPPLEPVILAGGIAPLGPKGVPSGIAKRPVEGPWRITSEGLPSDRQGDRTHHGGPEKALHHYPREHYAAWISEIGPHPLLAEPGAFGENISGTGWTEATMCVGDIAAFGSAVLQVSQGRQPCFRLDLRFDHKGMARRVQQSGRTGWYWRVLEPGTADAGDTLVMLERPRPSWPLARLVELLYRDTGNIDALGEMAELPELAESWRVLARRRLASGKVESWTARLTGSSDVQDTAAREGGAT